MLFGARVARGCCTEEKSRARPFMACVTLPRLCGPQCQLLDDWRRKYLELLGSIELDGATHFPHHRSVSRCVRGDLVLLTRPRQRLNSHTSMYSSWRTVHQLSPPSGDLSAMGGGFLLVSSGLCGERLLPVSSGTGVHVGAEVVPGPCANQCRPVMGLFWGVAFPVSPRIQETSVWVSWCRPGHGRSVAFCRFLPGRSMFLDFGSLHQKPRVGGTHGRVHRDGSDCWRSPVPRGDNTGVRDLLPPPPTIAFQSRRQDLDIVMDLSSCAS